MKLCRDRIRRRLKFLPGEILAGGAEIGGYDIEVDGAGGAVLPALAAAFVPEDDAAPIGVVFLFFATGHLMVVGVTFFGVITRVVAFDAGVG